MGVSRSRRISPRMAADGEYIACGGTARKRDAEMLRSGVVKILRVLL